MGIVNHFRKVAFKGKVQVILASHMVADGFDFSDARKLSVAVCRLHDGTLEKSFAAGYDHNLVARYFAAEFFDDDDYLAEKEDA